MSRQYIHWKSTKKNMISLPPTIIPSPPTCQEYFIPPLQILILIASCIWSHAFLYASTSKYKYLSSSPSPFILYKGFKADPLRLFAIAYLGYLFGTKYTTKSISDWINYLASWRILHIECSISLDGNFILKSFPGQTPALPSLM